jgi:hypothetical protein
MPISKTKYRECTRWFIESTVKERGREFENHKEAGRILLFWSDQRKRNILTVRIREWKEKDMPVSETLSL